MTFRNNVAAFPWGFSAIFLVLVAAMTYVFIRDETPLGYSPIIVTGAMALFWIGAVGCTASSTRKHCLRDTVQSDQISPLHGAFRSGRKKKWWRVPTLLLQQWSGLLTMMVPHTFTLASRFRMERW